MESPSTNRLEAEGGGTAIGETVAMRSEKRRRGKMRRYGNGAIETLPLSFAIEVDFERECVLLFWWAPRDMGSAVVVISVAYPITDDGKIREDSLPKLLF